MQFLGQGDRRNDHPRHYLAQRLTVRDLFRFRAMSQGACQQSRPMRNIRNIVVVSHSSNAIGRRCETRAIRNRHAGFESPQSAIGAEGVAELPCVGSGGR
jgi:hypothetical protein